MINKIQINPIIFRGYDVSPVRVTNPIDNKPREFNSDFYIDKNGAEAIKSYNIVSNGTEIKQPISFNDYVNQLERAGLKKDYDFNAFVNENEASVYVYNSDGHYPIKIVRWFDGNDANAYTGYEDIIYPKTDDIANVSKRYNKNGIMDEKTIAYNNPNAHKNLFPYGIDENSTPESYTNYLKQNGIHYEIEKGKDFAWVYEDNKETYFNIDDESIYISQHSQKNENDNVIHNFGLFKLKNDDYYTIEVGDFYRDAFDS